MTIDLSAHLADAVAAVPGVAYLSPNLRSLPGVLRPGAAAAPGVTVRAGQRGHTVEIRIAVRSDHSPVAVTRAARDAAAVVLGGHEGADTRVTVVVTAIV